MEDVLALFDALNGDDLDQARDADRMLRARLCRAAAGASAELAHWRTALAARGGALSWRGTQCLCAVLRAHPALARTHAAALSALAAAALRHAATAAPGPRPAARHCARLGALQLARAVLRALPSATLRAAGVLVAAAETLDATPRPAEARAEAAETAYEAARLCTAAARLPLPDSSAEAQEQHAHTLCEAVALCARVAERVRPVFAAQTPVDVCVLLGDVDALEQRAARAVLVAGWLLVRAAGVARAGAAAVDALDVLAGVSLDAQFALLRDSDSALVRVLEACAHAAVCPGLPRHVQRSAWAACTGTLDRLLDLVGSDCAVVTELVGHAETRALAFVVRLLHALLSPACPVAPAAAVRYRAMFGALRAAAEQGAFPFSVRPLLALIARYLATDERPGDVSAVSS